MCHLLVHALEEEVDIVLEEAEDGGIEAVRVGESGACHGRCGALDLPPDLALPRQP
jgi:hypothetical protein